MLVAIVEGVTLGCLFVLRELDPDFPLQANIPTFNFLEILNHAGAYGH